MGQTLSEPTGSWKGSVDYYTFDNKSGVLSGGLKTQDGSTKLSSVVVTHGMSLDNDDGKFVIKSRGQYTLSDTYSNVLPAGNWTLTAKNINLIDGVLSAWLQKPDGLYSHSTMVVLEGHVIENNCGKFRIIGNNCDPHFKRVEKLQCPLGSWINSAEDIEISMDKSQYILKATLTANDGSKKQQTIKYSSQYEMFDNDNGNFKSVGNCQSRFR